MTLAWKCIRAHDARWPLFFEAEKRTLQQAGGGVLLALHHIGSTAIPGLIAKPIIDILAEARAIEEIDAHTSAFESCGYESRGAYGIEGRRYFSKSCAETGRVGFHLHIYTAGSAQIGRHIRFRDYLIATPDAAREYAELKLSLSDANGILVPDYVDRKAPFIERIDRLAALDAD